MNALKYSADYIETTEHIQHAMKLLEMIDNKIEYISALDGYRSNESEQDKAERSKRLKFELTKELPNLHALASTARDLLADEHQRLERTTAIIMDKETEQD